MITFSETFLINIIKTNPNGLSPSERAGQVAALFALAKIAETRKLYIYQQQNPSLKSHHDVSTMIR